MPKRVRTETKLFDPETDGANDTTRLGKSSTKPKPTPKKAAKKPTAKKKTALTKKVKAKVSHKNVHVLLVNLNFKSKKDRDAWKKHWQACAEKVWRDEPRCLSYEFCDRHTSPAL